MRCLTVITSPMIARSLATEGKQTDPLADGGIGHACLRVNNGDFAVSAKLFSTIGSSSFDCERIHVLRTWVTLTSNNNTILKHFDKVCRLRISTWSPILSHFRRLRFGTSGARCYCQRRSWSCCQVGGIDAGHGIGMRLGR